MQNLTGVALRHAQEGIALKAEMDKLHIRNDRLSPRKAQRFMKWAELVSSPAYVPKRSDRIAIIGAGPAGLHLAFLLDELGFKDITLLEKTPRSAGKSYTKYSYERFIPIEFGTCYTIPFKYAELRRVAKEIGYGSFEEVPVPERHVFMECSDRKPKSQKEWLRSEKEKKFPFSALPKGIGGFFAEVAVMLDLVRYNWHFDNLFKKDIDEIIKDTNMSFAKYLHKYDFEDVIPLFSLANTVQGYGYVDQVPALYGLWWNNPDEVNGFLASGFKLVEQPASILRHGFERFWEFWRSIKSLMWCMTAKLKRLFGRMRW